jgi:hypothetical protein
MDTTTGISIGLMAILLLFSIDFERQYSFGTHEIALNPFARFLAGLIVAYLASWNIVAGSVALLVVFLWIADVHLLSSPIIKH